MDPRHPELALSRLKELIQQYDRIESDIAHATVSSQLGQLEREGGLVVQEMCLVAPRIHEAMMQASRKRRHQLAMGITYVSEEKIGKYTKATIGVEEEGVVVGPTSQIIAVNEATTEEAEVVKKPKRKTSKKKKAE